MKFLDIANKCILADISIALYRLPNDDVMYLVIDTEKAKTLEFEQLYEKTEGFVFHPYNSKNNPIWFIKPDFVISSEDTNYSDEFVAFIENLTIVNREEEHVQIDQPKQEYLQIVNDLINKLNETDLKKAVYSRTKTIEGKGLEDAIRIFQNLERAYESAFIFFVNISNTISWIGASPELLLLQDDEEMQTMALAGTQQCSDCDVIDIEWDRKEKREQQYVCEYIEKQLKTVGCEFIKGDTRTIKAGNVCHIETPYVIETEDENFWDIVKELHPTPAVCGMPAKLSFEEINSIEKYDRGYYTGFLGPLNIFSETGMYVNLRSARLTNNKIQLFVGGGITAESSAHNEWDETEIKSQTIINILCNE